jgi:hypothetical protein
MLTYKAGISELEEQHIHLSRKINAIYNGCIVGEVKQNTTCLAKLEGSKWWFRFVEGISILGCRVTCDFAVDIMVLQEGKLLSS